MPVSDTTEHNKPAVAPPIESRKEAVAVLNRIAFSRYPSKVVLLRCIRFLLMLPVLILIMTGVTYLAVRIKQQRFSLDFLRWEWILLVPALIPLAVGIISELRSFEKMRDGSFFPKKTDKELIELAYDLRWSASRAETPQGFRRIALKGFRQDLKLLLRYSLIMAVLILFTTIIHGLKNS